MYFRYLKARSKGTGDPSQTRNARKGEKIGYEREKRKKRGR